MVFNQNVCLIILTTAIGVFARSSHRQEPLNKRQGYISECTSTIMSIDGDSCETLADFGSITVAQFKSYNPQVTNCDALVVGLEYCLEKNYGQPDPTTSSKVSTSSSTLASSSKTTVISTTTSAFSTKPSSTSVTSTSIFPVAPPAPTQSGVTTNCNKWDTVQQDDTCAVYQSKYSVSLANLVSWNPTIGAQCTNLQIGSAICVSVVGFIPSTTVATSTVRPTTSSISGAVPAPGPTQSGVAANCNRWDLVSSGVTCDTITKKYSGLTLANLVSWNPAIGSQCTNLWLDYYVCSSVVGFTPPKASTTSSSAKPTATSNVPSPVQSGINAQCKTYYKVVSGDGCYDLATKYKITLANFYLWNPSVKDDCSGLWLDYYVCVGV